MRCGILQTLAIINQLYIFIVGVAKQVMFLAPSVTPWRYKLPSPIGVGPAHNPAFRLIEYDRTTGKHLDIVQYYLDLIQSNNIDRALWGIEYRATVDMNIPDVTVQSIYSFIQKLKLKTSPQFTKYIKWRTVSLDDRVADTCDDTCHRKVFCNFYNIEKDDYQRCVQNGTHGVNISSLLTVGYGSICLSFVIMVYMF